MEKPVRGRIVIDEDKCKGCEYCVIYCPKKCIELSHKINIRGVHHAVFVDPTECIACGICAQVCPEVCIEVQQRMGGPLMHKMEDTISKLIDSGLDKLRGGPVSEKQKKDKKDKRKTE